MESHLKKDCSPGSPSLPQQPTLPFSREGRIPRGFDNQKITEDIDFKWGAVSSVKPQLTRPAQRLSHITHNDSDQPRTPKDSRDVGGIPITTPPFPSTTPEWATSGKPTRSSAFSVNQLPFPQGLFSQQNHPAADHKADGKPHQVGTLAEIFVNHSQLQSPSSVLNAKSQVPKNNQQLGERLVRPDATDLGLFLQKQPKDGGDEANLSYLNHVSRRHRQSPEALRDLEFRATGPRFLKRIEKRRDGSATQHTPPRHHKRPSPKTRPTSRTSNISRRRTTPATQTLRPELSQDIASTPDLSLDFKPFGKSWNELLANITQKNQLAQNKINEQKKMLQVQSDKMTKLEDILERREQEIEKTKIDSDEERNEKDQRIAQLVSENNRIREEGNKRIEKHDAEATRLLSEKEEELEKLEVCKNRIKAQLDEKTQALTEKEAKVHDLRKTSQSFQKDFVALFDAMQLEKKQVSDRATGAIEFVQQESRKSYNMINDAWESLERERLRMKESTAETIYLAKSLVQESETTSRDLKDQLKEAKKSLSREREVADQLRSQLESYGEVEGLHQSMSKTMTEVTQKVEAFLEQASHSGPNCSQDEKSVASGDQEPKKMLEELIEKVEHLGSTLSDLPRGVHAQGEAQGRMFSSLQKAVNCLSESLEISSTSEEVQEAIKNLSGCVRAVSAETAQIRDELSTALKNQDRANRLSEALESKEYECQTVSSCLKRAQNEATELKAQLMASEAKVKDMSSDLLRNKETEMQIQQLGEHMSSMASDLHDKHVKIQELTEKLRDSESRLEANKELETKINGLENDLKVAREVERVCREAITHSIEDRGIKASLKVLKEQLGCANRENALLSVSKEQVETKLRAAQKDLDEIQRHRDQIKQDLDSIQQERVELICQAQTLSKAKDSLDEQLHGLRNEAAIAHQRQVEESNNKAADLERQLAQAKNEKDIQTSDNENQSREMWLLKEELSEAEKQISRLKSESATKETRLASTSSSLKILQKQAEESREKLERTEDKLKQAEKAYVKELEPLRQRLLAAEEEAKNRKTCFDEISQKFAECTQDNIKLREELSSRGLTELRENLGTGGEETAEIGERLHQKHQISCRRGNQPNWRPGSCLPFGDWSKWDKVVSRFLSENMSKLDGSESQEVEPLIQQLKEATDVFHGSLSGIFHSVERIASQSKFRHLNCATRVSVVSPFDGDTEVPEVPSIDEEKARRRASQPLPSILKHNQQLAGHSSSLRNPTPALDTEIGTALSNAYFPSLSSSNGVHSNSGLRLSQLGSPPAPTRNQKRVVSIEEPQQPGPKRVKATIPTGQTMKPKPRVTYSRRHGNSSSRTTCSNNDSQAQTLDVLAIPQYGTEGNIGLADGVKTLRGSYMNERSQMVGWSQQLGSARAAFSQLQASTISQEASRASILHKDDIVSSSQLDASSPGVVDPKELQPDEQRDAKSPSRGGPNYNSGKWRNGPRIFKQRQSQ